MALIQCKLGAITAFAGSDPYEFVIDTQGRAVAEVYNRQHIKVFTSRSDMYWIVEEAEAVADDWQETDLQETIATGLNNISPEGSGVVVPPATNEPVNAENPLFPANTDDTGDTDDDNTGDAGDGDKNTITGVDTNVFANTVASTGLDLTPSVLPLTTIEGIGKATADKLISAGITTIRQIADFTDDQITELNIALDLKGRIIRECWIEKAKQILEIC